MAPLTPPIDSRSPSESIHTSSTSVLSSSSSSPSSSSSSSPPRFGVTIAIGIGVALVGSFAIVASFYFFYFRQKQTMTPTLRRESWEATEAGVATSPVAPRKGLGRVLSVFIHKRRHPRGVSRTPSLQDHLPPPEATPSKLPHTEYEGFGVERAVELDGALTEDPTALFGAQVARQPNPFKDSQPYLGYYGPVALLDPVVRSEHDSRSAGKQRPENNATPPPAPRLEMDTMVITVDAPPAAWHSKRTGPPPPLTIEPPGMHSRSPSGADSAYSTCATAHFAYTYSSINVPEVPPLPSHISHDHLGIYLPHDGSPSLQYPPSPQTPESTPSMSRSGSDSGAQGPYPLAPPTPTHPQVQTHAPVKRIPLDATFECLGPLPANIPVPSPPHFRTAHHQQQQQQQQQNPFLTPRVRTPEHHSPVIASNSGNTATSSLSSTRTGETVQSGYVQDPLLHETNPFRPHHPSPVCSIFSLASVRQQHGGIANDVSNRDPKRRESTDSLGSNFTVEEEAQIQAQIVKNLEALDKERVMGESDIVHIPQVSERRYSWEA